MAKCYVLLLGGIGTGKSSVGRLLAERGAAVFDADIIGHQVLDFDEVKREIEAEWPAVVREGKVDRRLLASIVFGEEASLRRLESITHPRIGTGLGQLISAAETDLVVVEMPVLRDLVEGDWLRVVVDVPHAARLSRLVGRGMSEQDARARMRSQPSRREFAEVADFVIDNSGGEKDLEVQVDALFSALAERCFRREGGTNPDDSMDSSTERAITKTVRPWTRNQ